MIKREDIVSMLKAINIEQIKNDGPTSVSFTFDKDSGAKSFVLSVQNEFITVTTGKLLFKRKYRIHKNEL